MKKLILLVVALVMVFALCSNAYAVTVPAERITVTVEAVDYVSALAGIAKPTSDAYGENSRFAALVTIDIPSWYNVENMSVEYDSPGLLIDAKTVELKTGVYLIFGTVYDLDGSLKITLQDNALNNATTQNELWAAIYGDRTVSATMHFKPDASVIIPADAVLLPPQTGDKPTSIVAIACIAGAALCAAALVIIKRRKLRHSA